MLTINTNNNCNIFFTSDWHLGHDKDFIYQPRRCYSREDHVRFLIDGINSQAMEDDTIVHMGDMCLTSTIDEYYQWLSEINCRNIYSLVGNHDNRFVQLAEENALSKRIDKNIVSLGSYAELCIKQPSLVKGEKDFKFNLVLCHFPFEVWNNAHKGWYHLCGHSHGSLPTSHFNHPIGRKLDCGVENALEYSNQIMFDWNSVKAIMRAKEVHKVDHHVEGVN